MFPLRSGWVMPGRSNSSTAYRFGFNGKENDNEVKGTANQQDYGMRIYDARLGRFLSIDPLTKKYPDLSPFSYVADNPIMFIDPDGNEVKAYSRDAQTLIIKTLNYTFGEGHGFSFKENTLTQVGEAPKKMTPQQTLMFKYFNELLVKSQTITTIKLKENIYLKRNNEGDLLTGKTVKDGEATTFGYTKEMIYRDNGVGMAPTITSATKSENVTLVSSGLLKNGINLGTEKGDKIFDTEHALLHEFGHAIINVIMSEMGGQFNRIDFNKMSDQERSDWSIQFTNTLLQSQNQPLEIGSGQHGRDPGIAPDKKAVAPLTKKP